MRSLHPRQQSRKWARGWQGQWGGPLGIPPAFWRTQVPRPAPQALRVITPKSGCSGKDPLPGGPLAIFRAPLPWRSIRCSWNSIFWLRAKLSPQLKQRAPTGQWRARKCPQLSHQVPWSCQLPLSLPGELTGRLAVGGVSAEWGWHGLVIPPLSNQRRGRPFCVPTGTDLKRTLNQASDPQANCFPWTTTSRSAYNPEWGVQAWPSTPLSCLAHPVGGFPPAGRRRHQSPPVSPAMPC